MRGGSGKVRHRISRAFRVGTDGTTGPILMARCANCDKSIDPVVAADGSGACCPFCGNSISGAARITGGTVINGFEIIEEIGRGGMGVVYKAKQLNLRRDVAFKVLADELANDSEFVERFFLEARAAGSMNHPNIVQVYDAGSTPDGVYYFVMELIEGDTLEMRIIKDGAISPRESLRIAVKIADALNYAWNFQKLTHGDIKPENIIMSHVGTAKLADLGLAKWAHDETSSNRLMATPLYAPPEIIRGESHVEGFRSDMYSFGVTLFHMLAGAPPFPDGEPEQVLDMHLNAPVPSIIDRNEHISPAFSKVLESLLEKDPNARPKSWKHVLDSLRKIRSPETAGRVFRTHGHNVEHAEPSLDSPTDANTATPKLIKLLVALVLVLAIIAGGIFAQKRSQSTKKKSADTQTKTTAASLTEAEKAWQQLKPAIDEMDATAAASALKQLEERYGDKLPEEARVALKEKRKLAKEKEEHAKTLEKQQKEFDTALQAFLADLDSLDIKDDSNANIQRLKEIDQRAGELLASLQDSGVKIAQDKKDLLRKTRQLTHDRLEAHYKKLRRQSIEAAVRKRRERMDALAKKRTEEEKARMEDLEKCDLIDHYYLALASYLDSHLKLDLEHLANIGTQSLPLPQPYAKRVAFITKTALPSASKLPAVFLAHSKDLTHKRLPTALCQGKRAPLARFKIKGIGKTGIKLFMNNSKVVIGQTLKWTSLSPAELLLLASDMLLKGGEIDLSENDVNAILAFALLRHPKGLPATYNRAKRCRPNISRIWMQLAKDFMIAPQEKTAMEQFASIRASLTSGDAQKTVGAFLDFLSSKEKTKLEFSNRYKKEFERLLNDIEPSTPEVSVWRLLKQCEATSNMSEKFNIVMVLDARFANVLPSLGKKIRDKINDIKKRSLAFMMEKSGVESVADNRVPFYYWVREKQGAAWAYYNIIVKSKKLKKDKELLQVLKMAAAFDNGDWPNAIKCAGTRPPLSNPHPQRNKLIFNWGPPMLFARGMIRERVGNGQGRKNLIGTFISIVQKIRRPPLKPLAAALALEYALSSRQTSHFLKKCASSFPSAQAPLTSTAAARFALLRYLVFLENPSHSAGEIRAKGHAIAQQLHANAKTKDDALWVKTAADLASGLDVAKTQLKLAAVAKLRFKDVGARIMSSAIGRRHAPNMEHPYDGSAIKPLSPEELKILETIKSCLVPNIVAGDLWRRTVILSMASCSSMDEMADSIKIVPPGKTWISTTPFYASLLLLKSGAGVAVGDIQKNTALANLKRYLRASPTVSTAELKMLSARPDKMVKELFRGNQPEKAVVAGLFGMMIFGDTPKMISAISKELLSHYSLMTWEERMLTFQIQTWRLQCLEY